LNRRRRTAEENHLRIQTLLVEETLLPGNPERTVSQGLAGCAHGKFHFLLGPTGNSRQDENEDNDFRGNHHPRYFHVTTSPRKETIWSAVLSLFASKWSIHNHVAEHNEPAKQMSSRHFADPPPHSCHNATIT